MPFPRGGTAWRGPNVEGRRRRCPRVEGVLPFATALGLVLLLELGDKTQLAVIFLAAAHAAPLSVFLGGSLALSLAAVASVALGTALVRFVQGPWLRRLSAGPLLAVGAYLLLEAVLF